MISMNSYTLDQLSPHELHEIARLTLLTRQSSHLKGEETSLAGTDLTREKILEYLGKQRSCSPPPGIILTRTGVGLVGWLMFSLDPDMPAFYSYHPIISLDEAFSDIAKSMIKQSLNFAEKKGASKIIAYLDVKEHLVQLNEIYKSWYTSQGMEIRALSHYMKLSLGDVQLVNADLDEDTVFVKVAEVDLDTLYQCYSETFRNSLDGWNLDLTEKERRKQFDKMISSADINEETTRVIMTGNRIAGLAIIHSWASGSAYLMDAGVHPDFRRKKLGKMLLTSSIKKLAQQGIKTVNLHADDRNRPALKLYRDLGFQTVGKTLRYMKRFDK